MRNNTLKNILLAVLFISTQASTTPNELSVTGKWVGTAGSKNENNGTYFAFVLNADQSIYLLSTDKKPKVIAKGTYTYANAVLAASYTFKDGSSFHISGNLNSETQKFSGIWKGNGKYDSFAGKWIAIKK
jgi:hypothetical protein